VAIENLDYEKIGNIYFVREHGYQHYEIGVINPKLYTNTFILDNNCTKENIQSAEPLLFKLYDEGNQIIRISFSESGELLEIAYNDIHNSKKYIEFILP
jgi:hypothetical protein